MRSVKIWHLIMVLLKPTSTTCYQNDNHHYYQQFYREMYDFLDYEYGSEGVAWYQGRRPEVRDHRGRGYGH